MKKIVGSSKSANGTFPIQAVKVIPIWKKIFCVGNLQPNCTDAILKAYVTQMGVRVLSVHPAQSKSDLL